MQNAASIFTSLETTTTEVREMISKPVGEDVPSLGSTEGNITGRKNK